MFKNRKLIGLMISLAVTVMMGSVYLLSLQLIDSSSEVETDQATQEHSEEKTPEEKSEAHHAEHSTAEAKDGEGKVASSGETHGSKHEDKQGEKKEGLKETSEHKGQEEKTEHGKAFTHDESASKEESVDLSKKYRPRIIGRCKVLYERFNKMELQANQFHSFAYSFDGKSGYCADSGPQTSLKLAKEIALSDCEKNKGSAESYAPCFIYSSDK